MKASISFSLSHEERREPEKTRVVPCASPMKAFLELKILFFTPKRVPLGLTFVFEGGPSS